MDTPAHGEKINLHIEAVNAMIKEIANMDAEHTTQDDAVASRNLRKEFQFARKAILIGCAVCIPIASTAQQFEGMRTLQKIADKEAKELTRQPCKPQAACCRAPRPNCRTKTTTQLPQKSTKKYLSLKSYENSRKRRQKSKCLSKLGTPRRR